MARETSLPTFDLGDIVTLKPREDGIAHRDGNDARWEVQQITAYGMLILHLVGAPANRTCGALPTGVTLVGGTK